MIPNPPNQLKTPPLIPAVPKIVNPSKNQNTAHPDVAVVPISPPCCSSYLFYFGDAPPPT